MTIDEFESFDHLFSRSMHGIRSSIGGMLNARCSVSSYIMTGSYNNFFRVFDRNTKRDVTLEASREIAKPKTILRPKKVFPTQTGVGKRKKEDITVDSLDFGRKILHTAWHPHDNVLAVAATNNLYLFTERR